MLNKVISVGTITAKDQSVMKGWGATVSMDAGKILANVVTLIMTNRNANQLLCPIHIVAILLFLGVGLRYYGS